MSFASGVLAAYFAPGALSLGLLRDGEEVQGTRQAVPDWAITDGSAMAQLEWTAAGFLRFDAVGLWRDGELVHIDPFGSLVALPPGAQWSHTVLVDLSVTGGLA